MKSARLALADYLAERSLKSGLNRRLSRQVAAYLLSERRTSELNSLMRDVQADWATDGYVEVLASSAHPLSPALKKDIATSVRRLFPKAAKVQITDTLDPSIIGGVRLSLANQQWDLSVKAKLNKFKQLINT